MRTQTGIVTVKKKVTTMNRNLFALEDMEGLLQAVYATEEIPGPSKVCSAQNKMYKGLTRAQSRVIPIHSSLKDMILKERKIPGDSVSRPRA